MSDVGRRIWHLFEKLIHMLLVEAFKLLKKDLTEETFQSFMQFVKFGIVGLSNTVISYVIYAVCLLAIRRSSACSALRDSGYLVAQAVSFVLSVLWSFYWNNKFVFPDRRKEESSAFWWGGALIKMFISYSFTGLFLNSILLILWVKVMHISEFIAPVINLLVSVPLNFVINKFWTFGKRQK